MMALPTHSSGGNDKVPPMRPTPGVTPGLDTAGLPAASLSVTPEQGNRVGGSGVPSQGVPQSPDTPPAPPFLFGDIEPVHYARLYPEALTKGASAAKDAAMAAGQAAFEGGKTLHASQQDPVGDTPPEDPAKPPPPPPAPPPGPKPEAHG
jgi:hypothetical protein